MSVEDSQEALDKLCEKYRNMPGNTIPLLQEIQEVFGYLPEEAVNHVADSMDIPRSGLFGVATFYSQFYFEPRGRNIITVCCGTACHVKGSEKILTGLRYELKLAEDEVTTEDREFTVEKVNCVGACSIAPVVLINKGVNGKAATQKILRQVRALSKKAEAPREGQ